MKLSQLYRFIFPPSNTQPTLALLRFDEIGDYMMMRPFFPYLRNSKKYKDYKLLLIGRDNFIPLANMYDAPYFDAIFYVHYPPNPKEFKQLLKTLKRYAITELVSPTRYLEPEFTSQLFAQIKAPHKTAASAQTSRPQLLETYRKTASKIIQTSPNYEFEFNRYKSFFEQLIEEPIPLQAPAWHLPPLPRPSFAAKSYAFFAPYTSNEKKNFSQETAVHCLQHILSLSYAEEIYIVGDNAAKLQALAQQVNSARIKIYMPPAITEVLPLIQNALFVLTADTCFLHFGAQLGVKTIYVSGNNGYYNFHPYGEGFAHVRGIYPPGMLEHLDTLDPLTPTEPYTVKQISAEQICAELDHFLNPSKQTDGTTKK